MGRRYNSESFVTSTKEAFVLIDKSLKLLMILNKVDALRPPLLSSTSSHFQWNFLLVGESGFLASRTPRTPATMSEHCQYFHPGERETMTFSSSTMHRTCPVLAYNQKEGDITCITSGVRLLLRFSVKMAGPP